MMKIPFENLKPTEFENFSYELLDLIGFVNLDWKKGTNLSTSLADQGRDADYKSGPSYDSWIYYRYDQNDDKVIDSIIFMYISGNNILIDICSNYNNRKKIFMIN